MSINNLDQDIIILVAPYHIEQARLSIPMILKNLSEHNIIVVSQKYVYNELCDIIEKDQFIDENLILNKDTFKETFVNLFKSEQRFSWYYQQFLGFLYSDLTSKKNYINWNCDTVPLRHIDFVDKDGKYLFNRKIEHHQPYFDVINKIFINPIIEYKSYISEYMIYDTKIMKEMLQVFKNINVERTCYYNVLSLINKEDVFQSGFADFETYGTYMNTFHKDLYKNINLKTCRYGKKLIGKIPTLNQLENIQDKLDLDTISFENWDSL